MNKNNKEKSLLEKKEDIKKMFKEVQSINRITNEEYEMFCEGISHLPHEIINKIKEEVYFVIISSHKKYGGPACFVNKEDLKDKKGIIKEIDKKNVVHINWCGEGKCYDKIMKLKEGLDLFGSDIKDCGPGNCIICQKKTKKGSYVASSY